MWDTVQTQRDSPFRTTFRARLRARGAHLTRLQRRLRLRPDVMPGTFQFAA